MAKANLKKASPLLKSTPAALAPGTSTPADVEVLFTSGLGQLTASLFRNGVLINMESISSSGNIHFSDVQSGDGISINGVCAGNADITVSVPTNPATPEHFTAGIIIGGYTVIGSQK